MEYLWWHLCGWDPHCHMVSFTSIFQYLLNNRNYRKQDSGKSAWNTTLTCTVEAFIHRTNHPQFQWATCCLRPRGQVEKWQKVYHKGSHELTGKKNKHAVRRAWNRCCATGYIKWPEITQTQRNQSVFWERGVDVGKIHRGCPTETNYVPQRSLWHISGLSDDHFATPFVKFVIDWPRESEQVVCLKGLLRSLLPEKGEQNSGYRDVELGQHWGEREEKKWGESTGG